MQYRISLIVLLGLISDATGAGPFVNPSQTRIGVTRRGTPIGCLITADDLNLATTKYRVLIVAGLKGNDATSKRCIAALEWFYSTRSGKLRDQFALSAVAVANPDGLDKKVGRDPRAGYPPKGRAYNDRANPEAIYLWRWIGMHAPDLVVVIRSNGQRSGWSIPDSHRVLRKGFRQVLPGQPDKNSLADQLDRNKPSETGRVVAVEYWSKADSAGSFIEDLLRPLYRTRARLTAGPARIELQKRLERTPLEVARQLSKTYGHNLQNVVYIPALALISRIRLGRLTNDPSHLRDVERMVEPYVSGKKKTNPRSGSALSGHLVFCELAGVTKGEKRKRYLELARKAADLGLDKNGRPKSNMPFHVEMSDSVFMGGPILARVGALTGNANYFQVCQNHLRFMRKLDVRKDGLYRHSPLDQSAWGRGNGFPAIGMAMCLTHFPIDHPARDELIREFKRHLAALAKHQDPTGCWHQVIDHPESYRELTSTCMITFAMVRGMRLKILSEKTYRPIVQRAWYALKTRIRPNGRLVDVCTGTGKQTSLRAYYDRTAILGRDARGGAMSLLVSTELVRWQRERSK